jgi:hypothetical protein
MGTSTKYPGPSGGAWTTANRRLGRWVSNIDRSAAENVEINGNDGHGLVPPERLAQESDKEARELADQYRDALAETLRRDPAAFGLRDALRIGGSRLADTLESLRTAATDWFCEGEGSAQAREEAFVRRFTEEVAGFGGLVADAAIRRAAVSCAQTLLKDSGPLRDAVMEGKPVQGAGISRELFCMVFQLFFKDALTQFITSVVAGKVRLAFPVLHAIDPAGKIASWIGQQVAALIPNPCEQGAGLADRPSLRDLASGLANESVDRVLGIPAATAGGTTS